MDVSGGGVVNVLLFSQTGDQMADVAGVMVVNQNTEFIPADASADTAFADGILQKLSDKADGEVPFFMPVPVVDDL